jgi:hypothetical protein
LLVKVNRPQLRVSGDIPQTESSESLPAIQTEVDTAVTAPRIAALQGFQIELGHGTTSHEGLPAVAIGGNGPAHGRLPAPGTLEPGLAALAGPAGQAPCVLVVRALESPRVGDLRRQMLTLPRFRRNPNKLHDLTATLPFVIPGITRREAAFLMEHVELLGGDAESGAEIDLLGPDGKPRASRASNAAAPAAASAAGEVDGGAVLEMAAEPDDDEADDGAPPRRSAPVALPPSSDRSDQWVESLPEVVPVAMAGGDQQAGVPLASPPPRSAAVQRGASNGEPQELPDEALDDLLAAPIGAPARAPALPELGLSFSDIAPVRQLPPAAPPPAKGPDSKPPPLPAPRARGAAADATDPAPAPAPVAAAAPSPAPPPGAARLRSPAGVPAGIVISDASSPELDGVLLSTVDQAPGVARLLGLVTATVLVPAAMVGGNGVTDSVESGLQAAEQRLRTLARGLGGDLVLGVRTSHGVIPGGAGGVLLLMQGTVAKRLEP